MQPLRIKILAVAIIVVTLFLLFFGSFVQPPENRKEIGNRIVFDLIIIAAALSLLFRPHRAAWWILTVLFASGFLFSLIAIVSSAFKNGLGKVATLPYAISLVITFTAAIILFAVPFIILISFPPRKWLGLQQNVVSATMDDSPDNLEIPSLSDNEPNHTEETR